MTLLFILIALCLIAAIWSYNLYLTQERAIDRAKALLDHRLAHGATEADRLEAIALYNEAIAGYERLRAHPVCGIAGILLGKRETPPYGATPTPVELEAHGHGHSTDHSHEHGHEAVAM